MTIRNVAMVFFVVIFIFSGFTTMPGKVYAFDCVKDLTDNSSPDQKQACQNELNQLLAQVAELEGQLADQKKQTGTITGDINYLTSQINALKAKIKARTLAIANLKVSINQKTSVILSLQQKIDREKESLAQLLRNTNEFDNEDLVNLILSDSSLSQFYSDVESYSTINQAVKKSVDTILGIKSETEVQKADLQKQQNAEVDAKAQLEDAQKKVAASQAEQKQLLAISKQKEAGYTTVIADRQKRVADIKAKLFHLAGGAQAIRFDIALQYAQSAAVKTGIDPAFLLAVLTQESNLGANVGKCYLTDSSGAGVNINSGKVWNSSTHLLMYPSDVSIFMDITNSLGFSAYKTVVSCPASAGGYGGAMGPAQFIPSTWKLFDSRVSAITGSNPANPWAPTDAFMASALYLTDLGGVGSSQSAQNKAACKYYGSGGSSCSYSRSVAALKSKIQSDIDYLNQYGTIKQ
jgi:membrane-bound lytic murein transglycosylase B